MPYQTRYVPPELLTMTTKGKYYHAYDEGEFENPYTYHYHFVSIEREYDEDEQEGIFDIRELSAYKPEVEEKIRKSFVGDSFDYEGFHHAMTSYHVSVIYEKDEYTPFPIANKTFMVPYSFEGMAEVEATSKEAAAAKLGINDFLRLVPDYVLIDSLPRNLDNKEGFTLNVKINESEIVEAPKSGGQ